MINYKNFFGFTGEPFAQDIKIERLYETKDLTSTYERFLYAISLGAVAIVTGEVGSGKSTSLRYALHKLHPSQFKFIYVIASTGSVIEIFRHISIALNIEGRSNSIAVMTKMIKNVLMEINQRKQKTILIIDEAHLMRLEAFTHMHTLGQFEIDSKPILPIILSGQNNLLDKLMYHTSRPIASRVIARSHLQALSLNNMEDYLNHHLKIAGLSTQLFSQEAILAIHQGSGGLLRRANNLAKGALMAAATDNSQLITPEHVRIAATELI